jgi:hypothetical protein
MISGQFLLAIVPYRCEHQIFSLHNPAAATTPRFAEPPTAMGFPLSQIIHLLNDA